VRSGDLIGTLEQDLLNVVPSECFTATSVFRVLAGAGCLISPPVCGKVTIYIRYTDGSETTVTRQFTSEDPPWVEIDLKPYVEMGKTVKGIKIELNRVNPSIGVVLDACSCSI
jgi:hypothetical protein